MNPNLVPLKFAVRYNPPVIGLVYKTQENQKKKRIYEIHLNELIFEQADLVAK